MKIFNHFQQINLTSDQYNALEKLYNFLESNEQVFILQGYAGSGKTTLLKGLIHYLEELDKSFDVMAPTGRAAKILRDKTRYGQTIHRTIYNFDDLKTIENKHNENDYSFHYLFPLREIDDDGKILIIDEASMISSKEAKKELFTFGTDILLNDLLTYAGVPNSRNKVIFVGDPAQLPPVGDNSSKALMTDYFERLGLKNNSSILKEVVRQDDNTVLKNATRIRSLLENEVKNELELTYDDDFIKISSQEISSYYAKKFPVPEIGQGVIIAFSNSQCLEYNRAVRNNIFPHCKTITPGDLLIINQNNYHSHEIELMNGEMAKVIDVSEDIISRKNIPVYKTIKGKRLKKNITLNLRRVTIRVEDYSDDINCLIIDSLLNSPNRDLSILEMKALYVDFVIRFKNEQNERKKRGLTPFEVGKEEFKQQLKSDNIYNALRVKYGYAITCHKSQGGEWPTVFVDYYGRTSLKEDPLRWSYTATTRAVKCCFSANAPNVSNFSKFKIGEIQPLTNIPNNTLALNHVPISPYHNEDQYKAKSLKYWEVNEKLENTPFQIIDVNSLGGFQERYSISFENEEDIFDVYHNAAGIFDKFKAVHQNRYCWHKEILKLLNRPYHITYNIDYVPSIPVLEKLYGLIQSICVDANVTITNIVEKPKNYHVIYFLKTEAKCALIQFYFNGKGQLSRAIPKSTARCEDKKLMLLISKLQTYVI